MSDAGKYVTDEAVHAARLADGSDRAGLIAAAPFIRAEVLREAAEIRALFCSRYPMCPVADEAVGDVG